ncbi:DUF2004 domain-containing protein [Acidovorax sp. NPDC077693]|uniref:DUF2004 domain-containing protein n=1 Tax=unclassified Acidovorax TaxID=2684926 RepID=UPI0037CC050F
MHIGTSTFGSIEIGESAAYIKREIKINGLPQNCGLYIAVDFSKNVAQCLRIAELIDNIDAFDSRARARLFKELQEENCLVIDFIDFHLEEFESGIGAKIGNSKIDRNLLLQNLDLRGIGFHLHEAGEDIAFSLDYCPGEEFSDQLLVVKFRENEELVEVAHES